jgi:hypothetical protein
MPRGGIPAALDMLSIEAIDTLERCDRRRELVLSAAPARHTEATMDDSLPERLKAKPASEAH